MNRIYIYAAIAIAIVGGLLYVRHLQVSNHRLSAALSTAKADLAAERENTRKANEASERYAISLENLKAARAAIPTRAVRLCGNKLPDAQPAPGTDAPDSERVSPPAGFHPGYGSTDRYSDAGPDIGPQLYSLADEADQCHAQIEALQGWIRNR